MGLGITQASMVSAIADATGDASDDAVVKIRRLVNQRGNSFCNITRWPFLRSDISFDITTSAYAYSGAGYLPTTFKEVVGATLKDGDTRHPLTEVGIKESKEWENPDDYTGRPDEFCITRMESGYWQIAFNRKPDNTYTVEMEIDLHWSDLTVTTSETLITKEYFDAFTLFCSIARFRQQGDLENYQLAKDDWYNPAKPKDSMLSQILRALKKPLSKPGAVIDEDITLPFGEKKSDYDDGVER